MANDENLIPAKKGEIRNPNGRPKGSRNRQTIFRELLEQAALSKYKKKQAKALSSEEDPKELEQETIADQVATSVLIQALGGDTVAAREIMDSGYGKLTDKLDNTHSFTKMGTVEATLTNKGGEEPQEAVALSFDVGNAPLHEKGDEE